MTKRLGFIAKHLIQTEGTAESHVRHIIMLEEFPEQFEQLKAEGEIPESYPMPKVMVRMKTLQADRESEVFIKEQQKEEEQKQWLLRRREMFAAACCRTASTCKYAFYKHRSTLSMAGSSPSKSLSEFINHTVYSEKEDHKHYFSGQRSSISRSCPGKKKHLLKFDMGTGSMSGKMSRVTQTGPVKRQGKGMKKTPTVNNAWPSIWYNGEPTPVHEEAIDLIPKLDYWQFDFHDTVGTCKLTPMEGS